MNIFEMTLEDKKRILNLHESATKKHYLKETMVDTKGPNNLSSYPPCVQILGQQTGNGVEQTENNQYYVKGDGVNADKQFYNNGKYLDITNKKIGTYTCDDKNIKLDNTTTTQPTPATSNPERIQNIANAFNSLQNGIIVSPNSSINGLDWARFIIKFNITEDETKQAITLAKTLKNKPVTTVPTQQQSNKTGYLSFGSRGDDVKKIQQQLNVPDDGYFGVKTKQAVMDFQTKNNLRSDGIVGPNTLNALNNKTPSINPSTGTNNVTQNLPKINSANANPQINNPTQNLPKFNTDVNRYKLQESKEDSKYFYIDKFNQKVYTDKIGKRIK